MSPTRSRVQEKPHSLILETSSPAPLLKGQYRASRTVIYLLIADCNHKFKDFGLERSITLVMRNVLTFQFSKKI